MGGRYNDRAYLANVKRQIIFRMFLLLSVIFTFDCFHDMLVFCMVLSN